MHRHEHFELWLHDDAELAEHVDCAIAERTTLHEWPLSCVQRLVLADGRRLVYKSQSPPSVEAEFYRIVRSGLLVEAATIHESDGHSCMLLEHVDAPLLDSLHLPEDEVVRGGRRVMEQIAELDGGLPCFMDVGTEEKWHARFDETIATVDSFVREGKYAHTAPEHVRVLERAATSGPVLTVVRESSGYLHADFTGDNVFAMPDGTWRLIDWQYPRYGPCDTDLVSLLESLGFDAVPHVGAGPVLARRLLSVDWVVQCTARWIPAAHAVYDRAIAAMADSIAALCR